MKASPDTSCQFSKTAAFQKCDIVQLEMQTELLREKLARQEKVINEFEGRETIFRKAVSILVGLLNKLPEESKSFLQIGLNNEVNSINSAGKSNPQIEGLKAMVEGFAREIKIRFFKRSRSPLSADNEHLIVTSSKNLIEKNFAVSRPLNQAKETTYDCLKCGNRMSLACNGIASSTQFRTTTSDRANKSEALFSRTSLENPSSNLVADSINFKKPNQQKSAEKDVTLKSLTSEYELVPREPINLSSPPIARRNLLNMFNEAKTPRQINESNLCETQLQLSPPPNLSCERFKDEKLLLYESNHSADISKCESISKKDLPSSFRVEQTFQNCKPSVKQLSVQNRINIIQIPKPEISKFLTEFDQKELSGNHSLKNKTKRVKQDSTSPDLLLNTKTNPPNSGKELYRQKQFRSFSTVGPIYISTKDALRVGNPTLTPTNIAMTKPINVQGVKINQEKASCVIQEDQKSDEKSSSENDSRKSSVKSMKSSSLLNSENTFDFNMKKHSKDDIALFESFNHAKHRKFTTYYPGDFKPKMHFIEKNDIFDYKKTRNNPEPVATFEKFTERNSNNEKVLKKTSSLLSNNMNKLSPTNAPQIYSKISKLVNFHPSKKSPPNPTLKQKPKDITGSLHSNPSYTPGFISKDCLSTKNLSTSLLADRKNLFLPNFKKFQPKKSKKDIKSENMENDFQSKDFINSQIIGKDKMDVSIGNKQLREIGKIAHA